MVGVIVGGQGVSLAIEFEGSTGDAVGVTACGGTEVGVPCQIGFELIKTERDVGKLSVFVGHMHFRQQGTVGGDLGNEAVLVFQSV